MFARTITTLTIAAAALASTTANAQTSIVAWGDDTFQQVSGIVTPNNGFFDIAAGFFTGVAIRNSGAAEAWGVTGCGAHSGIGGVYLQVEAGGESNYALDASGTITAWSAGSCTPLAMPGGPYFEFDVAPTGVSGLALDANGLVNEFPVPIIGMPGTAMVDVAAGPFTHFARDANGAIYAWGGDTWGQVSLAPAGNGFTDIDSGFGHVLAIDANGDVHAWGDDLFGAVSGAPTTTHQYAVHTGPYIAVAAGLHHSLALRADGSIDAWGLDGSGQVSNVPAGNGFIAIAAGEMHSIAIRDCPGDCNGDGVIDVTDLLAVLGGDPNCDWNGDGAIDVSDILFVLGAWGSC